MRAMWNRGQLSLVLHEISMRNCVKTATVLVAAVLMCPAPGVAEDSGHPRELLV